MLPEGGPAKEGKLLEITKLFQINPSRALYVGDLPTDIDVGKKIGMKTAGVGRWKSAYNRLQGLRPDYLVDDLQGLESALC